MSVQFRLPIDTLLNGVAVPLAGGKLYFYASGTSTPLDTFSDDDLTVPNTNPVILNSEGRTDSEIFLQAADYKVILRDRRGLQIGDTIDPLHGSPGSFLAIAAIADLRALGTLSTAYRVAIVENYYSTSAGGGGLFYWDDASVVPDNGGTVIQATGVASGRWIRLVDGTAIYPEWFGALGNGIADDTTALGNAITAADGASIMLSGTYQIGALHHSKNVDLVFLSGAVINTIGTNAGFLRTANTDYFRARGGAVTGDGVALSNQYFVIGSTTYSNTELLLENIDIGGMAVCVDGSGALRQIGNNVRVSNTTGTTSGHGYGWDTGEYITGNLSATRFVSINGFIGDNISRHDLYCGAGVGGKVINAASVNHRNGIARDTSPFAAFVISRMSNVSYKNIHVSACNDAPFEISNDTQEGLEASNLELDISVITTPYGGVVGFTGTPQNSATLTSNVTLNINWVMPATNNAEVVDVYWAQNLDINIKGDFSASTSPTNVGAIIRSTNKAGPYSVTIDGKIKINNSNDALAELTTDACNAASDATVLFAATASVPGGRLFLPDTDVQNPGIVALNNLTERVFNAGGPLFMYGYNKGVIAVGAPNNVTAIWCNSPYPTRIRTGDANTTFINSTALRLSGGIDYAAPASTFIQFEGFDATHTFELSRSHDA